FWYRADKQNERNGFQYLAMCWDNGGICVAINDHGPGSFCIGIGSGSGDDAEKGTLSQNVYTQDEPDERWHHVAMTFDGLRVCIYRDGKLRANEEWTVYKPGNVRL